MKRLWLFCAAAAPGLAVAAPPTAYGDLYYIPTAELELGDTIEFEGDGFGLRGAAPVSRAVWLTGEYQKVNYDEASAAGFGSGDVDVDDERFRFGIGFQPPQQQSFSWGVFAEYISAEFEAEGEKTDADGFGLQLRGMLETGAGVDLYGQIGYVELEDDEGDDGDGPEYLIGGLFWLNPRLGLFADYRLTDLEVGGGEEFKSDELRVGARFAFGPVSAPHRR
jgi:hypothetical protein